MLRKAASGSKPAISQIYAYLHRVHFQREASKQPQPPRPERRRVWPYPDAPRAIDIRPLPLDKLSANRHVPILAHAGGYPFLRFKKPQSAFLSRVLRNKIKQKEEWFDKIKELDGPLWKLSAWEDEWDSHVSRELRREGREASEWTEEKGRDATGEDGWCKEVVDARGGVWTRIVEDGNKTKEMSIKMLGIVEKERKMWAEERSMRRHEKKVAKRRKKYEEAIQGDHALQPGEDQPKEDE